MQEATNTADCCFSVPSWPHACLWPIMSCHALTGRSAADAELDEDWAVEQGRDAEDAYFDDDA